MTTRQRDTPRALIRYALVSATVTVALVYLLYLTRDTLLLIYVAGLIAVGLSPLVDRLEQQRLTRRVQMPRWAAILSLYVVLFTVIGLFVMLMVPPLAEQARDLIAAAPDLPSRGQQWLIRLGILGREITIGEAVRQAPVGSTDAVTTVDVRHLGIRWRGLWCCHHSHRRVLPARRCGEHPSRDGALVSAPGASTRARCVPACRREGQRLDGGTTAARRDHRHHGGRWSVDPGCPVLLCAGAHRRNR